MEPCWEPSWNLTSGRPGPPRSLSGLRPQNFQLRKNQQAPMWTAHRANGRASQLLPLLPLRWVLGLRVCLKSGGASGRVDTSHFPGLLVSKWSNGLAHLPVFCWISSMQLKGLPCKANKSAAQEPGRRNFQMEAPQFTVLGWHVSRQSLLMIFPDAKGELVLVLPIACALRNGEKSIHKKMGYQPCANPNKRLQTTKAKQSFMCYVRSTPRPAKIKLT